MAPGVGLHRGFCFGGLGVCDPQGCRGCRGTAPLFAALCAKWRVACALARKHPPCAAKADAHAAARGGIRRAGSVTPARPRRSPRPDSGGARAGGALRKPPRRAQRARMGGAGRGKPLAHHPTGASGDRAHTRRPAQAARLCKAGEATGVAGCGLAKIGGLCYGWRAPSRRQRRRTG